MQVSQTSFPPAICASIFACACEEDAEMQMGKHLYDFYLHSRLPWRRLAHGSAGTRLGSSYSFFLYSESISSVVQALETSCSPQLLYRGLKPLPFNTDPREMKMQLNMHEGEMVGWHHPFNGHEFEQTPGYSEGHGSLACCSPGGRKVRHNLVTEQLDVNVHSSFIQNSKKLHNPNALWRADD